MTDPVLLTAFRAGRPEHTPEAEDVLLYREDGEATLVADDGETFTFSLLELRAGLGGTDEVSLRELEDENKMLRHEVERLRRVVEERTMS